MFEHYQKFRTTNPDIISQYISHKRQIEQFKQETENLVRRVTNSQVTKPIYTGTPPVLRLFGVESLVPIPGFRHMGNNQYVPLKRNPLFEEWREYYVHSERIGGMPWIARSTESSGSYLTLHLELEGETLHANFSQRARRNAFTSIHPSWTTLESPATTSYNAHELLQATNTTVN